MSPEFSRRVAKLMSTIFILLGLEEKWKFVDRISKLKDFKDASKKDKEIILQAERLDKLNKSNK